MINKIKIHNFKIHRNSDIPLAPLTIFTGINGMGKSSITQALLMLRDSVVEGSYPKALKIKGKSFDVGERFANLINWFVEDEPDKLSITLTTDCGRFPFEFRYQQSDTTEIPPYPGSELFDTETLAATSLFNDTFQYLSAFRFGPKTIYNKDFSALERKQVSLVNGYGEYAVAILEHFANEPIPVEDMALITDVGVSDTRLGLQASLWLNRISPNINLAIDVDGNQYMLNYTYPAKGDRRRQVSPLNTGFGISYVLSVVVALLISPKGSLVIIENPEAHIHPAAQSALMELISRAVKGGVQVIIETHSDHIVFGALVNMKRKVIEKNSVGILHFDICQPTGELDIKPIKIGPDCRIKNAPPRFVEQMNLDLDVLFDE